MPKKSAYRVNPRSTKKPHKKNPWIVGGLVLAAALLVLAILEVTSTTHLLHKQKIPAVIPTSSTSSGAATSASTPSSSSATQPSSLAQSNSKTPSTTGGAGNNLALVAPYGNFVSNHHPGGNSPLDEVSVCNTTSGASCYIKFTGSKGETQLASQTVNPNGSTSWSWNVGSDAHLTSGEWQITAVATLNGQSKSTDDPIKLVIQ